MKRDLRHYARQTTFRMLLGGLSILFVVGGGLIFIIYGSGAASLGFLCLVAGLLPVILIIIIFWFIEWLVKRANQD